MLPPDVTTLAALRSRHRDEEGALLQRTLEAHQWSVAPSARTLQVTEAGLRRMILRHPELEKQRKRLGPGRGRPKLAK
jgi:transcriptional regulator with GAF, ATPase, and Fis domain